MTTPGSVLLLTDLTQHSQSAVRIAGRVAELFGCRLDVLHAMGLERTPLSRVAPVLNQITQRIAEIDRAARDQVAAVHNHWQTVPAPIIDFASPVKALLQRAASLAPHVTVAAPGWPWHPLGRRSDAWNPNALTAMEAPLLLVGDQTESLNGRVLLFSSPELLDQAWIEAACDWHSVFAATSIGKQLPSPPDVDVVLVEEGAPAGSWARHVNTSMADLAVFPVPMVSDGIHPEAQRIAARLLNGVATPVLMLPRAVRPPKTSVGLSPLSDMAVAHG